jgi:hypothetical protein
MIVPPARDGSVERRLHELMPERAVLLFGGDDQPGWVTDTLEAELHRRRPVQYVDSVAIASLIVSVATLAWTVYTDLKRPAPKVQADVLARSLPRHAPRQGRTAHPQPGAGRRCRCQRDPRP